MQTRRLIPFIIALIALSAMGSLYYFNEFKDTEVVQMDHEIRKLSSEMDTQTSELTRLRDFAQNIERVKQELRELNLQLDSALEHMPRTFNLSGLLKRLTELAQNSGVELSSFKPKKITDTQQTPAFYNAMNIEFELKGTYVHSLQFLDQVSRLKRIINVEMLRLRAVDSAGATRSGGALAMIQGTFRTYRFAE